MIKTRQQDVAATPFPHVALEPALHSDVCRQLIEELPSLEKIANGKPLGNNLRFNFNSADLFQDSKTPAVWKNFVTQHTSQAFLDQVLSTFGEHIHREHGQLTPKLSSLRAGIRGLDDYESADVLLDVQIGVNSPVTSLSSVRGPHLDDPRKLFAGLLYLRLDEDESTGGDLQLYSPRSDYTLDDKCELPVKRALVEKTIPYQRNSLVMFLNTTRSFHGVTPRSITACPRWFINFVGQMRDPVFDVKPYQQPTFSRRFLQLFDRAA